VDGSLAVPYGDGEVVEQRFVYVQDRFYGRKVELHPARRQRGISLGQQQHRISLFTVPSGPSGFLIIGFQRIARVVVHDDSDVRLVDAHTERIGSDHDPQPSPYPVVLPRCPHQVSHAAVVESGRYAVFVQESGDGFRLFAGAYVDDARSRNVVQDAQQVLVFVFCVAHYVTQVAARETRPQDVRFAEFQLLHDVFGHFRRRRRGQRQHRYFGLQLPQPGDPQVRRAEVVSPLRDAVGFVDGQQRHPHFGETRPEQFAVDAFRRNVQEFHVAVDAVVENPVDVARLHTRMNRLGEDAPAAQLVDLIFHQRDQRRHDDAHPVQSEARHLVDDRFPASGRHQHQRIPTCADRFDRFEL